MRRALLLLPLLALAAAVPASGHVSGCHGAHSCPSDHHTYVWFDDLGRGNDCAHAGEPEVTAADTVTVVYDGRTYLCHFVGAYALPLATPSPSPTPTTAPAVTPTPSPPTPTPAATTRRCGTLRGGLALYKVRARKTSCASARSLGRAWRKRLGRAQCRTARRCKVSAYDCRARGKLDGSFPVTCKRGSRVVTWAINAD